MRIPQVSYGGGNRGVQRRGRNNTSLVSGLANAKARNASEVDQTVDFDPLIQETSKQIQDHAEKVTLKQEQDGARQVMGSLAQWETDFESRTYLDPADIPEGIPHSGAAKIHKTEVFAEMRRAKASELIRDAALNIGAVGSRDTWTQNMEDVNAQQFSVNKKHSIKAHQSAIKQEQQQEIQKLVNQGKIDEAQVVADGYIGSEADKVKIRAGLNHAAEVQPLDAALKDGNLLDIQVALDFLQDTETLTPQQQAGYQERLTRKLSENVDSEIYQQKKKDLAEVSDFRIAVSRGRVTESEIEAFYDRADNKYYSASNRTTDIKSLRSFHAQKRQKTFDHNFLINNQNRGLDHTDKHVKAGINAWMSDNLETFTQSNPDAGPGDKSKAVLTLGIQAAGIWGVLPKDAKSVLIAANNSREPSQMIEGLIGYRALLSQSPRALRQMSDSNVDVLSRASAYMDNSHSPESALGLAMQYEMLSEADKQAQAERVRLHRGKGALSENELASYVDDMVQDSDNGYGSSFMGSDGGAGWSEDYNIPLEMHSTFQQNFESELIRAGGNSEIAKRAAWNLTKRAYEPTKINGEWELSRRAPVEAPVDRLRRDIAHQGFSPDAIIRADGTTEIQEKSGQQPSYLVVDQDEETGNVVYGRYTPDVEKFHREEKNRQTMEKEAVVRGLIESRERAQTKGSRRKKSRTGKTLKGGQDAGIPQI